jgi:beta-lactamase regulating signal transducer with metallopeptidase domain/outer membrane lipoprotein-sorting protein
MNMSHLTHFGEGVFRWVLQTTWQAAVLAGLILLAQLLLRNRLSPAWRHGLWFLLLARLLMPIAPSSAVSVFNLAKWPRPRAAAVSPAVVRATPPVPVASAQPEVPQLQPAGAPPQTHAVFRPSLAAPAATVTAIDAAPAPRAAKQTDWMALAASAWLAGALVLTLRFVWSNHRFGRRLAGYKPVSDDAVMGLVGECAAAMGVKGRLMIIGTDEVGGPAVYGFWRKRLLLPDGLVEQLSREELRHVLHHELAHVRRRDLELNWLLAVLQILHWFNPVLWFAFARLRADRELATDELALANTRQADRASYGETILKVLEQLTQRPVLPGLVGIGESKAQMKERIRAIMRGGVGRRWRWVACAVAVVIASVALTSAREESQSKGINLLEKYPTTLTKGDTVPAHARPWQFGPEDIFQVSGFTLEVGKDLRVQTGVADLGIGHCADGAVWAVLIPHEEGKLTSSAASNEEAIVSVWLRFHPAQIDRLFPPETVSAAAAGDLEDKIHAIADAKFHSSWHAGNNAMIPDPKDMTVDMDTTNGPRRFFAVNTEVQTAKYWAGFADEAVQKPAYQPDVDTNCASVVSVTPPNGAKDVEPIQELHIRFDRAMDSHHLKLDWQAGGFQLNGSIQVSDDRKEFVIPVRLTSGQEQKLAINYDWEREMERHASKPDGKPRRSAGAQFVDADSVIANEFRWSFRTKAPAVTPGAAKPKVIDVSPASGATTPVLTRVEITFDQPMRPPDELLPYLQRRPFAEGPSLLPSLDYDSSAHRFSLPVLLPPDNDARLNLRGFFGANGVACDTIVLHYQTGADSLDASYKKKAAAASKDPELRKLLTSMKEARARLNSGVETVQTISLGLEKSAFKSIEAQTATFKVQRPNQAYADITGPMNMVRSFILGCDGQDCWIYSEDDKGEKRLDRTPLSVTKESVLMADPFDLEKNSVDDALAGHPFVLESNANLDGHTCYRVEAWDVSQGDMASASKTQWWIDGETFLPKQCIQYATYGCQVVRFDFTHLNEQLPDSAFQPPPTPAGATKSLFFKDAPVPGESRFLNISDGCNGSMSGRIGWHNSGGTTSSGLN